MSPPYKLVSFGVQPESVTSLRSVLSPREFHFQTAEDLDQLTRILKQGVPDLVYMPAETKAFDPFLFCSRLSKAGIAVLMISGAPTREVLTKVARHGAMDLLVSPLQPAVVGQKTDRALIKTGKKALPEGRELKMDFGSAKTPFDKVKVLIRNVKELLALPFAVVKIIRLCNDPSAGAGDIEKPVRSDPAIAAIIMQRANSAAFAGMGQTSSVQRAIMRIGMRATRNIAASFSVFKLFSKEEKSFGFNRVWFWVHSLTTGICAQGLAALLKYRQPEDAFIAGLLHDIGKMVLDDFLNEEFDKALRAANTQGLPLRIAEKSVFEADHTYVGSRVAGSWGFPSTIVEAIGQHHQFERFTAETGKPSLGALVCMANQMSKALQAGSGGDSLAEREASPLWTPLPKGVPWKSITDKVFGELKAYTDVLEIPPEQFQMEPGKEEKGKAAIFLPKAANYGTLLQIALERQGIATVPVSSLEDEALKEKEIALIIGDLSSVENPDEEIRLQKALSSLSKKSIILPRTDERNRPFHLDFFWLEAQVKKAMEVQGQTRL
ncbi:MAG: HDOD domain-containing protein [Thermodesulfobacteriota bacterium]